ncbi:hypothetical protein HY991_00885 [Candidatus Micrarchaeota archaeon]|nr:hypothetical protein [Candidatus Micrarchaeota archaeon]
MPDWITHILFAFILADLLKEKKSLVLVGAVLPDLFIAPWVFLKNFGDSDLFFAVFSPTHTPFTSFLLSASFSSFFKKPHKAIALLSFGWASHLFLDLFQAPVGYMLLWPFSYAGFGFNLVYSDNLILPAAVFALFCFYLLFKGLKTKEGFRFF